ncbi:MAG: efflux RND transporter periplasmic adaptor subunit [Bacteroidales bacterium]
MKKYKVLVYTVLGIIAVTACYWFFFRSGETAVATYKTALVERASISNTVTATGTVEPVKQVQVGTQVSGVIQKIYVDYNSIVKKGELLAELDKTPLLAQLASAKADLEAAASALAYQESNYNRLKQLFDKKAISETDYETALYQYSNAKANYARSSSDVDRSKTNLGYAVIYSPIDGVVLNRAVDEGQTVAASFNTPTLFTIAQDLTKMQVVANVDEADIGQVKEGQKVTFTVDAYPDDNFTGTVRQVRLLATTTANVVTYSVVIDAPNPELKLKPGLTASITAYTQEVENVLTIPAKAIRFKPDSAAMAQMAPPKINGQNNAPVPPTAGGAQAAPPSHFNHKEKAGNSPLNNPEETKTVWVKEGETIRPVQVTTGMTDETKIEIKSGLKEGQLVVVSMEQTTASAAKKDSAGTQSSPFMPKRPGSTKK